MSEQEKHAQQRGGLSLGSVLLVIFIVLKLAGLVAWSWLWVLSPLWIEVLLWFVGITLATTAVALKEWADKKVPRE